MKIDYLHVNKNRQLPRCHAFADISVFKYISRQNLKKKNMAWVRVKYGVFLSLEKAFVGKSLAT